jgi:hypothetical protein
VDCDFSLVATLESMYVFVVPDIKNSRNQIIMKKEDKEIILSLNSINYWLYSPGEQARRWEEDINSGTMSISYRV